LPGREKVAFAALGLPLQSGAVAIFIFKVIYSFSN
jgi:hypothetical protein